MGSVTVSNDLEFLREFLARPRAFTRAILDTGISGFELIGIESDRRFVSLLRRQLTRVRIVEGNAFSFLRLPGNEARKLRSIVSRLPVIGQALDLRRRFLGDAVSALRPGRPLVQFSYSVQSPLPVSDGVEVRRAAIVRQNLPPMHVWVYRHNSGPAR